MVKAKEPDWAAIAREVVEAYLDAPRSAPGSKAEVAGDVLKAHVKKLMKQRPSWFERDFGTIQGHFG